VKGLHHLRAAAAEAVARGKQGADAVLRAAKEASPEAFARSEDAVKGSIEASEGLKRKVLGKVDEGYRAAGETAAGVAAGNVARRVGTIAGQLPVLSLSADALREKHGVQALTERAMADPTNPMAHLWLAEAMAAQAKEQAYVNVVRTVANPSSLVVRQALGAVAQVGVDKRDPVTIMFGRAHALAVRRLRTNKRDSDALHVIARVHLAQRRPVQAVIPSKMAATAAAGVTRAAAFATLSRAFLALRQDDMARKAAKAAINSGCGIGWETIAALLHRPAEDGGQLDDSRYRQYVNALSRVTDEDRQRYYGFHRGAGEIARAVFDSQAEKARSGVAQIRSGISRRLRR
jgi:hypothetical protein